MRRRMGAEMSLKMRPPATGQNPSEWVKNNVKIPDLDHPIEYSRKKVNHEERLPDLEQFGMIELTRGRKMLMYDGRASRGRFRSVYTGKPTDAYGEVHFIGATRQTRGQYVRVGSETDTETAFMLMTQIWKMEQPKLVISVTSGAESFNLDPRLRKQFATGLLKVAETPGAWVITGGTNTGVMKHVGEALKGATNTCVGIATWGCIQNREALIADDTANENQDKVFGGSFPYQVASSLVERGAFLDHNHTHFLLVDDGSNNNKNEIYIRSELEKLLVEKKVPVVLLALQGDIRTLETIRLSLRRKIPVVLFKGSGHAADLLVNILEEFPPSEMRFFYSKESVFGTITKMIKEKLPEDFAGRSDHYIYRVIIDCLASRQLITVFQMDSGNSVDEAIITALLSGNSASRMHQLHFTLFWNRPELAEEKILSRNIWKNEELTDAMITALATNRVQFVKLFLEYGISLARIVNKDVLEFLYGYCTNSPYSILDTEVRGSYIPVLQVPSATSKNVMEILCDEAGLDMPDGCPFRELFLWAVLNGMHEMAIELWQYEQEGLMKALIAAEINNKLSEMAADRTNLPDEVGTNLRENAKEFQNLALQLLEECYKTDEKKALKLITGKSEHFNGQTCLEVAVNSNDLGFISHSLIQALLNDVFTGPIKASDISIQQYLLSTVFPPYLSNFDFRTEEEKSEVTANGQSAGLQRNVANSDAGSTTQLIQGDSSKNYKTVADSIDEPITEISLCKKFKLFHFDTPCVKFYDNVFVQSGDYASTTAKWKVHLSNKWNLVDIFANFLFYVALGLRLIPSTEHIGHMLYAFDAAIWILRLLHVFYAHRILGPYVVMIYRMFVDMMYFLTILVVFMLAYGVCAAAISVKHDNVASVLRDVILRPYFNIYGELFIDRDPESSDVTRFGYPVINKYAEPVGWILLGSYLLIANVLLLNLLIAIFGNTFSEVRDNASQIWKFQRYQLILEYTKRPPLIPPLLLFAHIYKFFKWLWSHIRGYSGEQPSAPLETPISDEERRVLNEFESNCLSRLLRSRATDEGDKEGNV